MRKYLFLVVLILWPSLGLAEGPVKVTSSYGPVEVMFGSGVRLVPTRTELPTLDIGDEIRTGPGAQMTLELPDGSYMVVNENTTLVIDKFWGSEVRNLVRVMMGKVRFFIQRLGGRPNPYRVNTPTALIAVRGTTFEVRVGENAATEVLCFEGRVTVETAGMPDREVILDAGRKTMVVNGQHPVKPVEMNDVFAGSRVLRVVRKNEEGIPGFNSLPALEGLARDNDRRMRNVDPLANPRGAGPALGQQIRRGKLTYPKP
jgi:hypothetical protein